MESILKRLAAALAAGAVESAKASVEAKIDQEIDRYLEVAAVRVSTSDDHLPDFVNRAIAAELRNPDTRAKIHALVHEELDKLIAQLLARLSD